MTEQWKFDENRIKMRHLWHFEFSQCSWNIFLNTWICKYVSSFILFTEMTQNLIFQLWKSKTCLISTLNKCKLIFSPIDLLILNVLLHDCLSKISSFRCKIIFQWKNVRRWHHQLTHLHTDCSRNVSWKHCETSSLLIILSDFNQMFTVLFEICYSFYWIHSTPGLDLAFKEQ